MVLELHKARHMTPIVMKKLRDLQDIKRCGKLLRKYAEKESISDLNKPDLHWMFTMLGLPIPKEYYRPWNNEERQRLNFLEDENGPLKADHFAQSCKIQKFDKEKEVT